MKIMKKIDINLNSKSITEAINYLKNYQDDFNKKVNLFSEKLGSIGITIAKQESLDDSHKFYKMVEFVKEWNDGYLYVIGRNNDLSGLHTQWYDGNGEYHTETISPIMALEFGTAGQAIKGYKGSAAVTGNHVNDNLWYYYQELDSNGNPTNRHIATSEEPHEMMHKAAMEMVNSIKSVAKEVWG